MPWLRRRPQPPASVLQQLDADERVVSFADVDGGVVVATPRGLWWPVPVGCGASAGSGSTRPCGRRGGSPSPKPTLSTICSSSTARQSRPGLSRRGICHRRCANGSSRASFARRSTRCPVALRDSRTAHSGSGWRGVVGTPGARNPGHRSHPGCDHRSYQSAAGCLLCVTSRRISLRRDSRPSLRVRPQSSWSSSRPGWGVACCSPLPAARCRNSSTWAWNTPADDCTVWLPDNLRVNFTIYLYRSRLGRAPST